MNDDNDESRRAVEHCYRTSKTMVNPIIDWTDEDVWEFLNSNGIPHCCLYDEGFKRLGCIGCPLSGSKNMERDFARWPKYRDMYVRAFQKMIDNHPGQIRILDPNAKTKFKLELEENSKSGGTLDAVVDQIRPLTGMSSDGPCSNDGKRLLSAEAIMNDWETHDGILSLSIRTRTANRDFKPAPQLADEGQIVFGHWLEMGAL